MVQKLVLPLYPRMDKEILYNFIDVEIPDFNPEFFSLWVNGIIVDHKFELGELSYVFCSDEYLLQMNKEHLNHDYYTDIITFDYTDDEDISHSEIMISLDRVKENATEHNESYLRELHRVCIHGMLHISGLDDQTDDEKQKMRLEENRILDLYCST